MDGTATAEWIGSAVAVVTLGGVVTRWTYKTLQRRERLDNALHGNADSGQPGLFDRMVTTERILADHIAEDKRIHEAFDRRFADRARSS